MERILKVITLDMKKKNFWKGPIISMALLEAMLILFYILVPLFIKGIKIEVASNVLGLIPYLLLVYFCFSMSQEFSNKTDKMIFTGIYSRTEIVISKIISFCMINLIFYVFYEMTVLGFGIYAHNNLSNVINFKTIVTNLYVFILYAFTLGSFTLLVSSITSEGIITGICSYVLYFDLILVLLNNALESKKSETLKFLIKNSPSYILNTGFHSGSYTLNQSIVLIVSGILFLLISCVIINRKNL